MFSWLNTVLITHGEVAWLPVCTAMMPTWNGAGLPRRAPALFFGLAGYRE